MSSLLKPAGKGIKLAAISLMVALGVMLAPASTVYAQNAPLPILPDNDTILLTVFLKHIQTMNNVERRVLTDKAGFRDLFPPDGVEIVDHYVMMGIGQVIILKLPPNKLRAVNVAIERGAWGAYETEFYVTYDLAAARAASGEAGRR